MAKVLEDQTFNLKPGEYTEPIRTKQGFVILKVTEHTQGGVQPLKDVEPQVEDAVYSQKMAPALRQYLTKLREDAYVEIKQGYEDSGATPNEIKPNYVQRVRTADRKEEKTGRTDPLPSEVDQDEACDRNGERSRRRSFARGRAAGQRNTACGNNRDGAECDAISYSSHSSCGCSGQCSCQNSQVASAGEEKPGKKEKIRYGQAPRETLPCCSDQDRGCGRERRWYRGGGKQCAIKYAGCGT